MTAGAAAVTDSSPASDHPDAKSDGTPHLFLVDGSGYIFRAFHALPPMTRTDGTPINAVYGFTNMLMKLLEDHRSDYLAVIFDAKRENFRNEIYPDYKGHRPDPPEELIPQFPLFREATQAFHVPCIEMEGYEADDIIATYARSAEKQGWRTTVVSSDKDLMQLMGEQVTLFDPMKERRMTLEDVNKKFGVGPDKVIEVQALAGDSSDNVPGVPGIGVKTAAELIEQYGDLETLLQNAQEIKQPKRRERLTDHADDARISKQLVTLKDDVPGLPELSELMAQKQDPATVIEFLKEQEFKTTLARYQSRVQNSPDLEMPENAQSAGGVGEYAGAPAAGVFPAASLNPDKTDYQLITEMAELKTWVTRIYEAGLVAVDTETDSLNPRRAKLVGISLSIKPGEACYIPVAHQDVQEAQPSLDNTQTEESRPVRQIPLSQVIDALKPVLEDPGVLKVGQNIKYDMGILSRADIHLHPMDDTMLLSYVLAAGQRGHGLDELSKLYLGRQPIKFKDVVGTGKNQKTFDQIHPEEAYEYAAEDADFTLRLYHHLLPELISERLSTVYQVIERPLVPIISEMEQNGIRVDPQILHGLSREFATQIDAMAQKIYKTAGHEFNIGSPQQLSTVLFDEMGLEGGKKTKTGAYQTGSEVLEKLAAQGHEIAEHVLEWRQSSKLKSTYSDALANQINPETGRVHTSFSLATTSTGRLSSSDPNLQNIPIRTEAGRQIRNAFIAAKGCKLISVDYSQIELRLIAELANVEKLKKALVEGTDIHALTASQVFDVPLDQVDAETRRSAKAINFGIIYGISAYGLARQLDIETGDAKRFIDAYFQRFPEIQAYMEKTKETARQKGYVTTLFGRRCHVPGINDKNANRRHFSERAAINAPLQGTAADIIKRAMSRLPKALGVAGLDSKLLLQVHDELILEAPEAQAEQTLKIVTDIMENAHKPVLDIEVPITTEGAIGDNWGEIH